MLGIELSVQQKPPESADTEPQGYKNTTESFLTGGIINILSTKLSLFLESVNLHFSDIKSLSGIRF